MFLWNFFFLNFIEKKVYVIQWKKIFIEIQWTEKEEWCDLNKNHFFSYEMIVNNGLCGNLVRMQKSNWKEIFSAPRSLLKNVKE